MYVLCFGVGDTFETAGLNAAAATPTRAALLTFRLPCASALTAVPPEDAEPGAAPRCTMALKASADVPPTASAAAWSTARASSAVAAARTSPALDLMTIIGW